MTPLMSEGCNGPTPKIQPPRPTGNRWPRHRCY